MQFRLIALLIMTVLTGSLASAADSGVTYQGRILRPDGRPISGATTQFRLQIRTPDSQNCLLYEEVQIQDLSDSHGQFSLTMNDGTGSRLDSTGLTLDRIFANRGTLNSLPDCSSGAGTWTPNASDGRKLAVYFKDETMSSWEPIPAQRLNYVPFAFEAKQVQGFTASSLVRVQESDGTMGNIAPLSNANYTKLLDLIAGKLNGATLPLMTSGQVLGWNGTSWTSSDPLSGVEAFAKSPLPVCGAGQFLKDNGSGVLVCGTPSGTATGTVTEVSAGTGLTTGGSPITTTGSIALATLGAGGTGFKITYDTYGRVTAAAALVEADIPNLTTAGKVSGDAITSGTIGGTTAINTSGAITTTGAVSTGALSATSVTAPAASLTALSTQSVQVFETTNSYKVTIQAPASLAANYSLTLPTTAGANGKVLGTTGGGVLTWVDQTADTGITALTGDVTASGSGSVPATIAVDAVTSAKIKDGEIATADLAAKSVSYAKIQDVSATGLLLGRSSMGPGSVEELSIGTGLSLSGGVLSNTVTDTDSFAALSVCGNGYVPIRAAGAWTCALATSAATNDAIMQRDSSGNFVAGAATLTGGLNLKNGALNAVTLAPSVTTSAYTLTLPPMLGSNGQVLTTNASGTLSWTTPASTSGFWLNGGNSFGASASLGTIDNFDVNFKTNNTTKMTIQADGDVGINTATPRGLLDVDGKVVPLGTEPKGIYLTGQSIDSDVDGYIGGSVFIRAGSSLNTTVNGTQLGGDVLVAGGGGSQSTYTGSAAGNVSIAGGSGTNIEGGNVFIKGGPAESAATQAGSAFLVGGEVPNGSTFTAGTAFVKGGTSQGFNVPAHGGDAEVSGGDGFGIGGSIGGIVKITGGGANASSGNSTGGPVLIDGGAGIGVAHNKGHVLLQSRNSPGGYGNVGIGTATPAYKLDVAGAVNATAVKINGVDVVAGGGITSLMGDVTGSGTGAVATTIAAKAVTLAKMDDLATGKLIGRSTASTGTPEAISIGTGLALSSGTLSSTVTDTDTFAAVTAACANTFVPYKSGGVWTCLQAATANSNTTLVQRDGSGNFAGNVATLNGVTLNNGGSLLNIVNPVGGAWTMTLPATAGSASQVLTTNGAGVLSWTTPSAGGGNLGTTVSATSPSRSGEAGTGLYSPGSNQVGISTGGTARMMVDSNGRVGIGTNAPSGMLDIRVTDMADGVKVFGTNAPLNSVSTGTFGIDFGVATSDGQYSSSARANDAVIRTGGFSSNGNLVLSTQVGTGSIWLATGSTYSNDTVKVAVTNNGNVGIGTTSPRSTLDVNGVVLMRDPASVSDSSVDFATGNLRFTTNDCGAFNLFSMKSGGSYSFGVQGVNSTTCSFNAYSSADTSVPLTMHMPPDHAATVASKHTLYTFLVMGTHVYATWAPGL